MAQDLTSRIEAAKAARRQAVAAGDHAASTAAMRELSLLAAEIAGVPTDVRFDPKLVSRFNRR